VRSQFGVGAGGFAGRGSVQKSLRWLKCWGGRKSRGILDLGWENRQRQKGKFPVGFWRGAASS